MNNTQQVIHILLSIFFLFSAEDCRSQEFSSNTYTSEKLQDIAQKLYVDYQIDCYHSTTNQVDGLTITIQKDLFGKINHIGFKLFSGQSSSIVYPFIERYLLNLYLLKDKQFIAQQMKEDKVSLRFGATAPKRGIREQITSLIPMLSESHSTTIDTRNSICTIICKNEKENLLEAEFPSNYQLLSGMNKKECESAFYTSLLSFTDDSADNHTVLSQPLERVGKNSYVLRGEAYQIEAMNTHRYYTSKNGSFEQLADTAYAKESIHNLFTFETDRKIKANATLRLYGHKKIEFSMPLHKLLEFCKKNGCNIYAGIESNDTALVAGTAILLNPTDGYNHLLAFKVNPKVLIQPEEYEIEINLHTFIPNHNIEALFYENRQQIDHKRNN